jgi:effector-binding domain-containing protein
MAVLRSLAHAAMAFAATACLAATLAQSPALAQMAPPPTDVSSPTLGELKARPTVALAGTAEWDEGIRTLAEAIDKLRTEMGKAGLDMVGNPFVVFVDTDDKGFRFEAMAPLAALPEPAPNLSNGLRIATSPAGKTMKFEHRGTYDEIDTTYEAITAYLDEKGLEAQNLFLEEYQNLPKTSEEDGAWVDIYVFLK